MVNSNMLRYELKSKHYSASTGKSNSCNYHVVSLAQTNIFTIGQEVGTKLIEKINKEVAIVLETSTSLGSIKQCT